MACPTRSEASPRGVSPTARSSYATTREGVNARVCATFAKSIVFLDARICEEMDKPTVL
jgi:hypothetical protein